MAGLGGDDELDKAIDDLRGVLKTDAEGGVPDAGFDASFGAESPASDFSASFGADLDSDNPFAGSFGTAAAKKRASMPTASAAAAISAAVPAPAAISAARASAAASSDLNAGGFDMPSATKPAGSALESNLDLIMDIPIEVQIILGSSKMQVASLMNLTEGATIGLDRRIGEPVEIMVNGRIIGRGEITVLENDDTRFGVKLIEVIGGKK